MTLCSVLLCGLSVYKLICTILYHREMLDFEVKAHFIASCVIVCIVTVN